MTVNEKSYSHVKGEEKLLPTCVHSHVANSMLYLWKQQNGLCPLCHQKITRLTGWHNHHTIWRTYGGSDTVDNRVLLHPNCHRQVHSQSFDVAPPRSTRSVGKA